MDLPSFLSRTPADPEDSQEHIPCITPPSTSEPRTAFGIQSGATVRGWPSSGGIYILDECDGVELDFLHLDRFTPANSSEDAALEDRHCEEMRKLGAMWWSSEDEYVRRHFIDPLGPDPDEKVVIVGWAGSDGDEKGGIWVLSTTRREANWKGVGRIKNAFSMEERCRVIESLGGVFYANPMDCPDLDLRPATVVLETALTNIHRETLSLPRR